MGPRKGLLVHERKKHGAAAERELEERDEGHNIMDNWQRNVRRQDA